MNAWEGVSWKRLKSYSGDCTKWEFISHVFAEFLPEAMNHFAEHRSAPFSMIHRERSIDTQVNNVVGTLNVPYAIRDYVPEAHLIKLGTMGEYGIPNIDIEEEFIEIQHNGRKDLLPFPN